MRGIHNTDYNDREVTWGESASGGSQNVTRGPEANSGKRWVLDKLILGLSAGTAAAPVTCLIKSGATTIASLKYPAGATGAIAFDFPNGILATNVEEALQVSVAGVAGAKTICVMFSH